ncbi:ACT domain-containing protein, partial [uncultured Selenomonas sp.]|uniref:ACT domain-containing protein n=1 Tax=uncultured Selenomonas sp. TaxID=159275 RepID=UPI0028E60CDE
DSTPPEVSQMLSELKAPRRGKRKKASHGVLVEGEGGYLVRLARCCNPIPGDPITGYITRGRGVSVHRSDCPNVLNDTEFTRVIEVSWDIGLDKEYTVGIEIICNDRNGMLSEILAVPAEMKVNIHTVNATPNRRNKTSTVLLGLNVSNIDQITQVMTRVRLLKDVYRVTRTLGSAGIPCGEA